MTAPEPPPYPYIEVFADADGYDTWRVTREESSHQRTFATLDELAATLKGQKLPIVTDSEKLAEALRKAGVSARYLAY